MRNAWCPLVAAVTIALSPPVAPSLRAQQAGPTATAARAGFHPVARDDATVDANATNPNAALDVGLLIRGGAALIVGIIIGGTGGIVLARVGAIVAIVGFALLLTS